MVEWFVNVFVMKNVKKNKKNSTRIEDAKTFLWQRQLAVKT